MRTIRSRMTPLRQRMWEDLQLRNDSEHTIRAYLHCVADFAKHFRTSPEHLGPEQVRTYQLFLVQEKQVAWPSVVQTCDFSGHVAEFFSHILAVPLRLSLR